LSVASFVSDKFHKEEGREVILLTRTALLPMIAAASRRGRTSR
jgi:hypothetical protein